jgi:hypothetical protein
MITNPEPDDLSSALNGKRTVVKANASGPEMTYFFQTQRWMPSIGFEKFKRSVGQPPNFGI